MLKRTRPQVSRMIPIGSDEVMVPGYYYKVVYSKKRGEMTAFVLADASSSETLDHFIVSVDRVEQLTGIDFFPELPDDVENSLEATAIYWN